MTYQCEKCGYKDNPIWKPLYWKLYTSYADLQDFQREYPELTDELETHFQVEDDYYAYKLAGKTRKVVHRWPKAFAMMRDRKLYEKTPSEIRKKKGV
jgi:hypothetical protein